MKAASQLPYVTTMHEAGIVCFGDDASVYPDAGGKSLHFPGGLNVLPTSGHKYRVVYGDSIVARVTAT